mmetsp:Transcript_22004/g.38047  ORF Transcript_22004/g.38047 Transcript_22004/m.38047 type:complete len:125 (-) Transcript_22004:9-383(-)
MVQEVMDPDRRLALPPTFLLVLSCLPAYSFEAEGEDLEVRQMQLLEEGQGGQADQAGVVDLEVGDLAHLAGEKAKLNYLVLKEPVPWRKEAEVGQEVGELAEAYLLPVVVGLVQMTSSAWIIFG